MTDRYFKYTAITPTPIGPIGVVVEKDFLIKIDFLPDHTPVLPPQNRLSKHIVNQLVSYFKNPHHIFSVPLHFEGTHFQEKVWRALPHIPPGQPLTYGGLAKKLKTGARAVGNACRRNPIPIITPCHRIVAASHIGGFSGQMCGKMTEIKTWLLQHEGLQI